jgi:hypothetical protein
MAKSCIGAILEKLMRGSGSEDLTQTWTPNDACLDPEHRLLALTRTSHEPHVAPAMMPPVRAEQHHGIDEQGSSVTSEQGSGDISEKGAIKGAGEPKNRAGSREREC